MTKLPGILLAAPSSGSGKTIAACGLMAAFRQMGKNIRACKCGPDYIDPMFHRTVLGIESENPRVPSRERMLSIGEQTSGTCDTAGADRIKKSASGSGNDNRRDSQSVRDS